MSNSAITTIVATNPQGLATEVPIEPAEGNCPTIEELQDKLAKVECEITTLELKRNEINLKIEEKILDLCSLKRYFQNKKER